MKSVIWSPQARADLNGIDEYTSNLDTEYADRVGKTAILAARYLAENPFVGPTFGQYQLRKWPIRKSPYLILYRPVQNGIEVVRVRHSHEDWKPNL
jgi:toxin ParE1/3/4